MVVVLAWACGGGLVAGLDVFKPDVPSLGACPACVAISLVQRGKRTLRGVYRTKPGNNCAAHLKKLSIYKGLTASFN